MGIKNFFKKPKLTSAYIITDKVTYKLVIQVKFSFFMLFKNKIKFFSKTLIIGSEKEKVVKKVTVFSLLNKINIYTKDLPVYQSNQQPKLDYIKQEDFKLKNNQYKKIDPNIIEKYNNNNLNKLRLNIQNVQSEKYNKQNFINFKLNNITYNESK
jgi:hypothetical protein